MHKRRRKRYGNLEITKQPIKLTGSASIDRGGQLEGGFFGVPWWIWLLGTTGTVAVIAWAIADNVKEIDLPLSGAPVNHRERANGVHPDLQAFLDWWTQNGPFPLVVMTLGGLRTDELEQARLYAAGRTKAKTLAETPHGRGGALDLYPFVNGVVRGLENDPDPAEAERYFKTMGSLAKQQGLKWGGDFWSIKDLPHVELKNWKDIPFPPVFSNA